MRTRFTSLLLITFAAAALLVAPAVNAAAQNTSAPASRKPLPAELADSTFWRIVNEFSENEQDFTRYYVSNETFYPGLVQQVLAMNVRGGAYIGVAPEQNYHYIAAIRPQIAFVLDIRRQAVMQHMMYKAIFELSATRADFISLLFSKPRPSGIAATASAFQTWTAFWYVPTDTSQFRPNLTRIFDQLTKKHKFPLNAYDSAQVRETYAAFYIAGPNLQANGNSAPETSPSTFGNLTSAVDNGGVERSFLASEEAYQVVRQLHSKNLVIPIVGDFAGVHALRTIGRYLAEHNTQLTAFYQSNVVTYLNRDGRSAAYYQNVATLPLNAQSIFISGISPGHICNIQIFLSTSYSRCG